MEAKGLPGGKDEDRELLELQRENLRITNEHLKEQTQFYREQNELSALRRKAMQKAHSDVEEGLLVQRRQTAAIQRHCNHRKGGKGDDLVNNSGADPAYSIIRHQYPWGEWSVLCTRCFADWRPGDTAETHPSGIGFEEAFKWNTDNSASGSAQFLLPPARVAEIRRAHHAALNPELAAAKA